MRNILLFITFVVCFNAFSQEKVIYTYRQKDSTLIISGKGEIQNDDVNKYKDKCLKVEINEGIERIQFFSFCDFKLMKEIQLPNSLRVLGKNTFVGCASLESVVIPPKVRWILGSFTNCDNLKYITLPDTVGIDLRAFDRCRSLKRLSFGYLSSYTIYHLEGCDSLEFIEVRDTTSPYKTWDGMLYIDDEVIIYPYAKKDRSCRFPDFIRKIKMLENPYVEEIYVSDDINKIELYPCENLKMIRSENKIFYDRSDEELKMDSFVIQVNDRKRKTFK